LPVHHLDEIARVGGGNGPLRPAAERDAAVSQILRRPRWIVEGIHLDWTDELLSAADMIVWLDHVSWRGSSRRIVRRFVRDALGEMRRQKGHRKFTRLGDYARQLGHLARSIPEARAYHSSDSIAAAPSRAATLERLTGYASKLIHCQSERDVRELVGRIKGE
jgi:hypothetical protein